MAYREPPEKPVKGRVQGVGKAFSRGQEFSAPFDEGMRRDPLTGDGQEKDPTRYGGYHEVSSSPVAAPGYSVENNTILQESDSRMFRGKGGGRKRY